MADNNLKIQANVEMPSAQQINTQIKALEKKLNKLTISGQFDASALKNMTKQLDSIKATVSTANFSSTALKNLTGQVEKAMSSVKTPETPISNIQNKISSLKKSLESIKALSIFQNIGKGRISIRISKSVKCFEYALHAQVIYKIFIKWISRVGMCEPRQLTMFFKMNRNWELLSPSAGKLFIVNV